MRKILLITMILGFLVSCKGEPRNEIEGKKIVSDSLPAVNQDMMETAIIYEANIRQYSADGSFDAFTQDIPKLKDLGVKIIWLMPIHPISMKNRKATGGKDVEDIEDPEERKKYLGSYYSISDYRAVNPEHGKMEDFDKLVATAHENEMYVILDWVANHTGWDHQWLKDHPDWYTQNEKGEPIDPVNPDTGESWGWTDVADLNFDNKNMRKQMIQDMLFWVREHNVDGFRADAAHSVPTDFWETAADSLNAVKPMFMLAEAESPKELFHKAFDMGYNWEGHHLMNSIANGEKNASDWDAYMQKIDTTFQDDDFLMNFVTNHDENSWAGTVQERMGDAAEAMLALTYSIPGMPLIYSGQEYDMDKRLKFFEKDSIPKTKGQVFPLLEKLGQLKTSNAALHGGKKAASYQDIKSSSEESILAFKREKGGEELYYIANMSDEKVNFNIELHGEFVDYMKGAEFNIKTGEQLSFDPWEYKILLVPSK